MNEHWMQLALQLAQQRRGFCAPNPSVGCVIVRDSKIIGQANHQQCGSAHAEVNALQQAGDLASGATAYVTLEPCNHHGRTPPCTEALIQAGISKVFFAYRDPNPTVLGLGQQRLQQAGIDCQQVDIAAIDAFYQPYQRWLVKQETTLTAKIALSLDGKIAAANSQPIAISGSEIAALTQQQRKQHDCIVTSIRTVVNDDPQLNARCQQAQYAKPIYVLDRLADFPLTARIVTTSKSVTVLHGQSAHKRKIEVLQSAGIHCIELNECKNELNLTCLPRVLAKQGMHTAWIEVGGKLLNSFLQQQLLTTCYLYINLQILGNDALTAFTNKNDCLRQAKQVKWCGFGQDVCAELSF